MCDGMLFTIVINLLLKFFEKNFDLYRLIEFMLMTKRANIAAKLF